MGNDNKRPFDVLDDAKEGNVLIKLKKFGDEETTVSGELQAFDKHLNVWLQNATVKGEDSTTEHGRLFVRGDNVLFVSPE
ncbi:small nuclear ribonucleoprotein [Nanohaloarchaea archaeon H01]|jgi:small nuclear ribonucleoprotein (snRNP)-like protein|nr:small nuclear ribonucleoprotein [Nanohaloarchaea archaeon H12]MBY6293845.1 small nuclear ribonucleoprotein [Nanohaloarchaea archaeon H01]